MSFTKIFNNICKDLENGGKVTDMSTEFSKLKTDLERIQFVSKLPELKNKILLESKITKDEEKANKYKEFGNSAYKSGKVRSSVEHYTNFIRYSPDSVRSVGFANRSASFYHLGKYAAAIRDIDRAIQQGYPVSLRWKIILRKAKCYKSMGESKKAKEDNIRVNLRAFISLQ